MHTRFSVTMLVGGSILFFGVLLSSCKIVQSRKHDSSVPKTGLVELEKVDPQQLDLHGTEVYISPIGGICVFDFLGWNEGEDYIRYEMGSESGTLILGDRILPIGYENFRDIKIQLCVYKERNPSGDKDLCGSFSQPLAIPTDDTCENKQWQTYIEREKAVLASIQDVANRFFLSVKQRAESDELSGESCSEDLARQLNFSRDDLVGLSSLNPHFFAVGFMQSVMNLPEEEQLELTGFGLAGLPEGGGAAAATEEAAKWAKALPLPPSTARKPDVNVAGELEKLAKNINKAIEMMLKRMPKSPIPNVAPPMFPPLTGEPPDAQRVFETQTIESREDVEVRKKFDTEWKKQILTGIEEITKPDALWPKQMETLRQQLGKNPFKARNLANFDLQQLELRDDQLIALKKGLSDKIRTVSGGGMQIWSTLSTTKTEVKQFGDDFQRNVSNNPKRKTLFANAVAWQRVDQAQAQTRGESGASKQTRIEQVEKLWLQELKKEPKVTTRQVLREVPAPSAPRGAPGAGAGGAKVKVKVGRYLLTEGESCPAALSFSRELLALQLESLELRLQRVNNDISRQEKIANKEEEP